MRRKRNSRFVLLILLFQMLAGWLRVVTADCGILLLLASSDTSSGYRQTVARLVQLARDKDGSVEEAFGWR